MNAIIQHPTIIESTCEHVEAKQTWRTRAHDWRESLRAKARRAAYGADEFARKHPHAAATAEGFAIGGAYMVGVAAAALVLNAAGIVTLDN